jgi:hypothetical protein
VNTLTKSCKAGAVFPPGLKSLELIGIYGGTEAPPLQSEDRIRGSLVEKGFGMGRWLAQWVSGIAVCAMLGCVGSAAQMRQARVRHAAVEAGCRQVVFDGDVKAGQGYEKVFARGLRFYLEPLRSGWIVRVLATGEPRGAHDYAELATPPYRSVSPLLISTDWSFRAQDAIAWNPREFHYAADGAVFKKLEALYPEAIANDPASFGKLAMLVAAQPSGVLQILDARIAPGLADQGRMASMVALHLGETPHEVVPTAAPTPLGHIEELRFRVTLELPRGAIAAPEIKMQKISCASPTTQATAASE